MVVGEVGVAVVGLCREDDSCEARGIVAQE